MSVTVNLKCWTEVVVIGMTLMLPVQGGPEPTCHNRRRAGRDDDAGDGAGSRCADPRVLGKDNRRRTVLIPVLGRANRVRQSGGPRAAGRAGGVDGSRAADHDGVGAAVA